MLRLYQERERRDIDAGLQAKADKEPHRRDTCSPGILQGLQWGGDPVVYTGRCRAWACILGRSHMTMGIGWTLLSIAEWSGARKEGPCLEILSHCVLRSSGAEELGCQAWTGQSKWSVCAHPSCCWLWCVEHSRVLLAVVSAKGESLFGLERLWRGKELSLGRNGERQLHQGDGSCGRKKWLEKERTRCYSVFVTDYWEQAVGGTGEVMWGVGACVCREREIGR